MTCNKTDEGSERQEQRQRQKEKERPRRQTAIMQM